MTTDTAMHQGITDPFAVPSSHSDTNLFFRRLPRSIDDEELRCMFESFGKIISAAVMRDIHTGESLGTAFVRFAEHTPALEVMKNYANTLLPGSTRSLIVQWAKRQHDDAIMGDAMEHIRKLFIRNIPLCVTEQMLYDLMSGYGNIEQVTLHSDTAPPNSARPFPRSQPDHQPQQHEERLIAFITFGEDHAAAKACKGVHNTCPFPMCGNIPLMTKLAEDNRERYARRGRRNHGKQSSHTASSNSGTSYQDMSYSASATSMGTYPYSGNDSFMNASYTSGRGHPLIPPRNGPYSGAMMEPPYQPGPLTTQVPHLSPHCGGSGSCSSEIVDMSYGMGSGGASMEAPLADYLLKAQPPQYPGVDRQPQQRQIVTIPYTNGGMSHSGTAYGPTGADLDSLPTANLQELQMPQVYFTPGRRGSSGGSSTLSRPESSYLLSKAGGSRGRDSATSIRTAASSSTSSRYRYNPYNPVNPREGIM